MKQTKSMLDDYKRYLILKDHKSCDNYLRSIHEFMIYLKEHNIFFRQVDFGTAIDYRSYLLTGDKNLSRGTVNNKFNHLRSFYTYLFKKQLMIRNPFRRVKGLRKGKTIPKNILSVEDMGILLKGFSIMNYSDLMLKLVLEFLYGSSLRIIEAGALKTTDLDFEKGALWVTNFKNSGKRWKTPATEVSLCKAKTYIKEVREKLLSSEELKEDWLFPQPKGKTTLRSLLNRKLKRECQRLGLKPMTSHGFRHSSATHMLKAGAGIRQVQMLLGHNRITSTQTYLRIVKEDLKSVLKNFHPREMRRDYE